jgi:hypothetical protein
MDEEMQALGNRLQAVDLSFDTIDQAWQERAKVLAHTPSLLPVSGFFSDGYGWRKDPLTGERAFHEGVDIVAETGTPVRAPADGIVVSAGRNSGYGKAVDLPRLGMDALRPPLGGAGAPRAARAARRRHRPRRVHRTVHRAAPALRGLQGRPAGEPPQVPAPRPRLIPFPA